ncbi:solute carrier family 25 member 53 [Crotalus tigris]|uniref:solute carrier family 25 member 53 n=1 Tax=Crotalus tigris TaxID=88082 RepID=UPI00192F2333|nr:solute carrier family 25 member 53 [Crotalus tigris]XP_039210915.1 solute carrier family 25 member 53 [Crotalus tigris]
MEEERERGQRQRGCRGYFLGAASSSLSTLATFPIYKTIFRQQLHAFCITEAVRQLCHEGFCQIYRGAFPPLMAKTLQGTLMFGTYNSFYGFLSNQPWGSFSRRATAGLFSGFLEALVFCPFERVQNVLQDGTKVQRFPTTRHILTTFRSYPLGESFSLGFYRGLGLILIRNGLGSSLYFALEEPLRSSFSTQSLPVGIPAFLSGSISGTLVCLLLYPLGILIANMQSQVGRQETLSLLATMAEVWKARGRKAWLLYRGGSLLILRSSLTWGLTTAIYQFLSKVTS